jgi:hypothetical protein
MKTFTQNLKILVAIVFAMTFSISAQEVCNDPAACNYMMANENESCVYVVTHDMISDAQEALDLAQAAYEAAQDAYESSSSARASLEASLADAENAVDETAILYSEKNIQITNEQNNMQSLTNELGSLLVILSSEVDNLNSLEINLDIEQVAMAAAQLALQGAQEYLDQTQAIANVALADFELVEYENFEAGQAVQDAWEAYNFASNLQDNALEALGVAQLEQEATQYAVDLGVSALNSASEELINALGELGLAEEATAAKAAIVASAQASMEAAVAALELAQAVSDAALTDFNAAEVENFELATAMTDALALHSFYEDAYANAMEELGIAQAQQEATQYAADLAASSLNQASEELIGALGAIGLAEEATAAKAAILDGANAGMDLAQSGLDQAQYALDVANASFADAYAAVNSAQSTLSSAQSYANPLLNASQDAQNYYNSLDSEICTYTPEVPSVELTPYVPSYELTPYVAAYCVGGYWQTITPAVPAVTAWVPEVCTPYIPATYTPQVWVPEVCLPWIGCSGGYYTGGDQITPAVPSTCTGGYYETVTPAIPAVEAWVPEVCTPAVPATYSPEVPATYSPYIPATTVCIPNPEVAVAATAMAAAMAAYEAALSPIYAAELALDGVLATQDAAQAVVDLATNTLNDALQEVQDQVAIVQNAQGDLDLAQEAENNANAAYQAAQDPVALAEEAQAFANDAAALALEAAGDWQALVEQNAGNALAALNTYEATAPLAEIATIALEAASAAMEIANAEYNAALQDQIDQIAMFQNAQADLNLAEEAENNAQAAYQAAQDPEAAAQAALDLAQTAADHAVNVVADAQSLIESGAGNLLALLNDYEELSVVADAAQATLDVATTAIAEANDQVNSSIDAVNSQLSNVQSYEYTISDMMAAIDLVTSTVLDLQYNENMLNGSIAIAEDLILVMTGEAFDLSQTLNEVTSTLEENVAELDDAVVMESNMMASRNAALIVLDEDLVNMSNMPYSGDCAICDVDVNGNGYVNTNDLDLDGVCDDADILGCTNESAINYDASATTDDESCIQTWADMEEMIQNQLEEAYATGYNEGFNEGSSSSASLIDVHLDLPSGWSMFGYTCLDSQNVIESLGSISSEIEIVKDEWGMSYLPDWGFDAIGEFSHGEGYQIKLHSTVEGFQFCKTLIQE